MIIIGIDPGHKGAIAWLNADARTASVVQMPLLKGTDRDQYDVEALFRIVWNCVYGSSPEACHAFFERLHPMPMKFRHKGQEKGEETTGGGVIANYNRGAATWLWVGLLTGLRIPFTPVRAQEWQRAMLENVPGADTKAKSVFLARRLFPQCSLLPTPKSRKPSDGMSDALCVAAYGQRVLAGDKGAQRGLLEAGA